VSDGAPFAADPFDGNPFDDLDLGDALAVEVLMGWDGATCATCGRPLGTDPEDELEGDAACPPAVSAIAPGTSMPLRAHDRRARRKA
jgi:hypothetical protein